MEGGVVQCSAALACGSGGQGATLDRSVVQLYHDRVLYNTVHMHMSVLPVAVASVESVDEDWQLYYNVGHADCVTPSVLVPFLVDPTWNWRQVQLL